MSVSATAARIDTPYWRDVLSLTKPRLSSLVIITTAGAGLLAGGASRWPSLVATVIGTAMIVGAANALNCFLERDADARMSRTASRPLPQGRLHPDVALWLGRILIFLGLPMIAVASNLLAAGLASLALVTYVFAYTPLKPRTAAATLVGAVPGALPPLIGWTAMTGHIDLPGLVLFGVLFLWQIPHFLAIGLFRQAEYERAGFRILPSTAGPAATRRQIVWYTAALLPMSLLLVPAGINGVLYAVVAIIAGVGFLGLGVRGLFSGADSRWARRFFFGSLLYLTILVAGMVADVVLVGPSATLSF